jgi:hypothetical protein
VSRKTEKYEQEQEQIETNRRFEQPLLPAAPRPESDAWAGAWAAEFGHLAPGEAERRLSEVDSARALIGLQPMTEAERAPLVPSAEAAPSLRDELLAQVAKPIGPAVATKAELDRVARERDAARLAAQTRIRQELAPSFTRSAEAAQSVQTAAKEYATPLRSIRATSSETYLAALPKTEGSVAMVTRLYETVGAILTDFDTLPDRLLAQGAVLDDAVQSISEAAMSPQERHRIVTERAALENLCELAGAFDQRIRQVMSLLRQIETAIQRDATDALFAAEPPTHTRVGFDEDADKSYSVTITEDSTPQQKMALARQLAGRK